MKRVPVSILSIHFCDVLVCIDQEAAPVAQCTPANRRATSVRRGCQSSPARGQTIGIPCWLVKSNFFPPHGTHEELVSCGLSEVSVDKRNRPKIVGFLPGQQSPTIHEILLDLYVEMSDEGVAPTSQCPS